MAERTHSVRLRLVVDQLRRDAAEASNAVAGIGSAAQDAGRQSRAMDALGNAARSFGRTAAAVGTVAVGSMAALGVATIRTGISYNALEQSTRAALTTLLGSAEAATAQMDKLREFVRTALFPREVFIEGQQQLLAFGFAAESVIPTLDAVQNAVAATGGSAQVFSEVVKILAEMQSTGEITAGTLNELGRRGINAAALIGEAMGQTENEIRQSITSGALDGRDAINVLVDAMESRFAGAAALISNTWVGATGLVSAALRDIGSALVEPFIDPAGGGAAVEWAQNLAEVLYALERQIRDVMETLRTTADPAFDRFGEQLLNVAERIKQVDIGAVVDQLSAGAPAFAAFGAAAAAAGGNSILAATGFAGLAAAVNPLTAAIAAAVVVSPELRQALFELLDALAPLIPILIDTGVSLATSLASGLTVVADLVRILVPLVAAVVDVFGLLPAPIQSAVIAIGAFALALRMSGPVGVALTAIAALGALLETFKGQTVASTVATNDLVEDLDRLATRGRVTGELWRLFGEDSDFFRRKLEDANSTLGRADDGWSRFVESIGLGVKSAQDARERFESLDKGLADLASTGGDAQGVFDALVETYELTEEEVDILLSLLPEFNKAMERQGERTKDAAEGQEGLAGATQEATNALKEQADEMRAQVDPLFALARALQDVDAKQKDFNAAVEEFGRNSPEAEAAAVDLFEATLDLQAAAGDASGAFNGKLTPAMRASLDAAGLTERQIDAVEDALREAAEAGRDFEDVYDATVEVHGDREVKRKIRQVREMLAGIERNITIGLRFETSGNLPVGGVPRLQHGGPAVGPAGVDRVPAMLTAGEHVWTVREVEAAGGHAQVEALRAAVLANATRFAVGGPVGMARMQAGGPVTGGGTPGWHVDNLNVQAWSGRFSLRQVEDELAMHGAA